MESILTMSFKKLLTLIFISLAIIYIGLASAKIYRWQLHHWLGAYWLSVESNNTKNNTKHYIFTMVDHYEPGFDSSTAILASENWLNKFESIHDAELDMIDMAHEPKKNSRLSCQIIITDELDGLEVTTPEKQS